MKIFASLRFYWGAFIISFNTAVFMIPALMLFGKRKGTIVHHINRLTLFMMGGKLEQAGIMDTSVDLYVMNHQGIVDIIGLEALQNNHLRWVAKKELFEAPWFGNLLRHGEMISLDRSNKAGLIKLIKDVKESREVYHRAVAIFPEGTRADDQPLLNFKQGTNLIAKKLELRVQPIVITGSKWVLNEHIKTGHNGTVKYEFLPAFNVKSDDKEWFDTVRVDMQKVIDDEFNNNHRSR
ncbi:lysophospholipid acyltransferase family protein [Sulfurovum sp.]|uniref:lysophospholipid acyltransferase family protein n=1 Tax=Sulfurovum sp. TaxID=1969726 RepID=UPI0028681A15|nr:lysophospholipid acyltransferase family protein [Sulfurovum sp.]